MSPVTWRATKVILEILICSPNLRIVQFFGINFLGIRLTVGGHSPKVTVTRLPQLTNHTGTIHTMPGTQRHLSPILPSVSEIHAVLGLTCIPKCMKKLGTQPVRAEFASTESFSRTVSSAKAPCCARTCGTKTDALHANVSTRAAARRKTMWHIPRG